MGRENQDDIDHIPQDDSASDGRADEARENLDKVPPPGTDPLHEGP